MGNEALGRGIVEAGVTLAASYPGTPASEILAAVVTFAKETGADLYAEWSVNEKVAFEVALANSMCGRRSAVSMKQVGLNVASDPFMRAAYLGVKGGLVVIAADDPGPHSSQTEQDSRFFAMFAKVPVLDPSSPREAKDMVAQALELSERYELPVMVRPTTRVCHARQNVPCGPPLRLNRPARFEKDPRRWCATPVFVLELHRRTERQDRTNRRGAGVRPPAHRRGRLPSRRLHHRLRGGLRPHRRLAGGAGAPGPGRFFPGDHALSLEPGFHQTRSTTRYQKILVIEETYPVIELQLANARVQGRTSGLVPRARGTDPGRHPPGAGDLSGVAGPGRSRPPGRRRPPHPLRRLRPPGGVLRHSRRPSRRASSPATSAATPWA